MSADPVVEGGELGRYRAAVEKPISLRFDYFSDFVRELSANISLGGMFVQTAQPRAPGSQFDFEFKLGDDFTLIRGRAEVVWTRPVSRGSGRSPGMGVRYLELDSTSTRVIERMVEQHAASGEAPFDLEKAAAAPAAGQPLEKGQPEPVDEAPEPAAEPAVRKRRRKTRQPKAKKPAADDAAAVSEESKPAPVAAGKQAPEPKPGTEPEREAEQIRPADSDPALDTTDVAARAELARLRGEAEARLAVIDHLRRELDRVGTERAAAELAARREIDGARQAEAVTRTRFEAAVKELAQHKAEVGAAVDSESQTGPASDLESDDGSREELRGQIASLEADLARWRDAAETAKEERQKLAAELETGREALATAQTELETGREALATAQTELEGTLDEKSRQTAELTGEVKGLRQAVESAAAELEVEKQRVAEAREELAAARAEGEERQTEAIRETRRAEELGKELDSLRSSRQELAAELQQAATALAEAEKAATRIGELEKRTLELEVELADALGRRSQTGQELDEAHAELARLKQVEETAQIGLAAEFKELRTELKREQAEREEAEAAVAEGVERTARVEESLAEAERRREAAETGLEEVEERLTAREAELARAEERRAGLETELAEAASVAEGLEAELAESREAERTAAASRAEVAERAESLERRLAEVELSRQEAENEAASLRQRGEELEGRLAERAAEAERLGAGDLEARARIQDLRSQIDTLGSELAAARQEGERLEAEEQQTARRLRKLEKRAARAAAGGTTATNPVLRWGVPAAAGLTLGLLLAWTVWGDRSEVAPPAEAAQVATAEVAPTPSTGPATDSESPDSSVVDPLPAEPDPSPSVAAPPTARGPDLAAARAALDGWAAAWSAQDPEGYLASYSPEFEPPDALTRDAWEEQRRVRLRRPEFIRVTLDDVEVVALGADRVRISFLQSYESNTFGDEVRKTVELVEGAGAWRIVSEASE